MAGEHFTGERIEWIVTDEPDAGQHYYIVVLRDSELERIRETVREVIREELDRG